MLVRILVCLIEDKKMDFVSARIITDDIKRLVRFYEDIGLTAIWYTEEFAEMPTSTCTLAIPSKRTMDLFGAGAAIPGSNHSLILEFRVRDVDEVYSQLDACLKDVV